MAKIRRLSVAAGRSDQVVVETEDGRLLALLGCPEDDNDPLRWHELPAIPESDEEREERETKERLKAMGMEFSDE